MTRLATIKIEILGSIFKETLYFDLLIFLLQSFPANSTSQGERNSSRVSGVELAGVKFKWFNIAKFCLKDWFLMHICQLNVFMLQKDHLWSYFSFLKKFHKIHNTAAYAVMPTNIDVKYRVFEKVF